MGKEVQSAYPQARKIQTMTTMMPISSGDYHGDSDVLQSEGVQEKKPLRGANSCNKVGFKKQSEEEFESDDEQYPFI